jgi:hypothetical protein
VFDMPGPHVDGHMIALDGPAVGQGPRLAQGRGLIVDALGHHGQHRLRVLGAIRQIPPDGHGRVSMISAGANSQRAGRTSYWR